MSTGNGSTPPRWQPSAPPSQPSYPSSSSGWPGSSQQPFAQTVGAFQVATPLQPGGLLNNTHRVDQMLGRGGMGEVYRGTNVHTGDQVAIKVIRPELVDDGHMRDLFLREATALRKIRHPAVVSYEGASADPSGRLYLVMDFVEGPSLAQFVAQRSLTPAEMRALRRRVAEGLQAAHEQNVVHRDLSPDNIVLRGGDLNHATIIDFGIARRTDAAKTSLIGQSFAGKVEYAAPEQFGMYTGVADARSDIYTLGLVLVAAVQGYPLDMGASPVAAIEARKKVPDLSRVPAELRPGLSRMLEPDPAARPQSMREVAGLDALDATGGARRGRGLRVALLAGGLGLMAAIGSAFAFTDPVAMIGSLFGRGASAAENDAWRQAGEGDTAAGYQAFIDRYPKSRHVAEARRQQAVARQRELAAQEEANWREAAQADSVAGYRTYLAQHPDGSHAAEARDRLAAAQQRDMAGQEEEQLWRHAEAATTVEPVTAYLTRYPAGRYAEAARRKLAGMQQSVYDGARTWAPVSCDTIPLWSPWGFTCRVSNDYPQAGRFRTYATGGVASGWQSEIWMHVGIAGDAFITTVDASQSLRRLNPIAQAGTDWSTVLAYGGAEYMTFRHAASNCVALRKPGPARAQGYAYVFTAVHCAPPGAPLYPNDIRATIEGVRVR